MKALMVEDDFTSRTVLVGVLKKSGYNVVATSAGAAAWAAWQQPAAPTLAILDWMMPELASARLVGRNCIPSLRTTTGAETKSLNP